jgi:prepilin-type N-terminal cleavage/methylation domain-containing protein
MKKRYAFTMVELIFVIVVIGILSKFGVEFLRQAYDNFIATKVNNELQAKSQFALEFIAKRLQYRIKDSIIARKDDNTFTALASASTTDYTILEWVGTDIENLRGNTTPNWSGIIDIDASSANLLVSPDTNTTALNSMISILSNGTAGIDDAALYFIGSNNDVSTAYGWTYPAATFTAQQGMAMHPIQRPAGGAITQFESSIGVNFGGVDLYEYYQLAWSAYAVRLEDGDGDGNADDLVFYYNYRPWAGKKYSDVNGTLLMQDVDTFQFMAIGSVVKIQICTTNDLLEEYSLCKEKTVF